MNRIYFPPQCEYTIEGKAIRTDKSIAHKVSGTSMGGILKLSPWSTPFQVACNLLGLAKEDVSGKPVVVAGQILEPVVIEYADEAYSGYGQFLPADAIFEKREGDHDSWVSDFEDDVFAGHVDGAVIKDDGSDYILEIKTSSNLDSWSEGVPPYYFWQVALYNEFISKKDKAYVVLGMMDEFARRNPFCWTPTAKNVVMYEMPIDRKSVQAILDKVRDWYKEYILNGVTPEYDPENPGDVEMYNHLVNLAQSQDEVKEKLNELIGVNRRIDEAENSIQAQYARRDELKEEIKDYLVSHDLNSLEVGDFKGIITTSTRKSISKTKLMEAGIDPDKYSTETVSKSFTIKRK